MVLTADNFVRLNKSSKTSVLNAVKVERVAGRKKMNDDDKLERINFRIPGYLVKWLDRFSAGEVRRKIMDHGRWWGLVYQDLSPETKEWFQALSEEEKLDVVRKTMGFLEFEHMKDLAD